VLGVVARAIPSSPGEKKLATHDGFKGGAGMSSGTG